MKLTRLVVLLLVLCSATWILAGTTGKITGSVKDAATGQGLPGANVLIKGTAYGAVTDLNGDYTILNVPPGVYSLQVSFIGYNSITVTDVKVNIDLTTSQNIRIKEQTLVGEEITVRAERPIVQKDLAASQMQVSSDQIVNLPVASVGEAVGLQAGVTSGLSIRGSASNQALFMVDGVVMRDERDNAPITKIPLSAVQQVSVQAGGFGAEYSNVRSGLVNVVTRDGDPNRYSASVTLRYKPPAAKYFGDVSPFDPMSYWFRPYMDDAVCWTGTDNGVWDSYTQKQYPKFAKGWNGVSEALMNDKDPSNDLSPQAAQRLFEYEFRKQGDIKKPDYLYDFGFGGPVPLIGKKLGNLRFFASSRREREMYMMALSREDVVDQNSMLKLISDVAPSMKLSLLGMYGETDAVSFAGAGATSYIQSAYDIAGEMTQAGFTVPTRMYTNNYYSPTQRFYSSFSGKLAHVLSPKTFYEAQVQYQQKKYYTRPGKVRDTETLYTVLPGVTSDERPFGYSTEYYQKKYGDLGLIFGGPISTAQDYSKLATFSGKFDLVSQVNRNNQIKTGFEVIYDNFDMSFGSFNPSLLESNTWTTIEQKPVRATLYAQDKLEFQGFIATLGVIADYSTPNSEWYTVDPFDRLFFSQNFTENDDATFKTKKVDPRITVSPRLSVSHPITEYSKLYFNYGHYRQMPTSERLYRVQRKHTNQMDYLGDPTIPLARTVSYELGYDHALFDTYLIRLAAYYKDITDQEQPVTYISFDGKVNYTTVTNNSYEDIRGFEADLSKTMGRWLVGNINYEYRVSTSGYFGWRYQYENPAEQRNYQARNPQQSKPRPIPRLKSFLDFRTPADFGPKVLGHNILGDFHFNTIGRYTGGSWMTWNPQNLTGIQYNLHWKDSYGIDLKFSKTIRLGNVELKGFLDIFNALNTKSYSNLGYFDTYDYNDYFYSLHLPKDVAGKLGYNYIPGDDRPGEYRKEGVEFQPMAYVADVTASTFVPNTRAIYYEGSSRRYLQYDGAGWSKVPEAKLKKVLDDKAYIDMPNMSYFTFLNPREIFFGITLNYNF